MCGITSIHLFLQSGNNVDLCHGVPWFTCVIWSMVVRCVAANGSPYPVHRTWFFNTLNLQQRFRQFMLMKACVSHLIFLAAFKSKRFPQIQIQRAGKRRSWGTLVQVLCETCGCIGSSPDCHRFLGSAASQDFCIFAWSLNYSEAPEYSCSCSPKTFQ